MNKLLSIILLVCVFLTFEFAKGDELTIKNVTSEAGNATIEFRVNDAMSRKNSFIMKLTLPCQLKPINYGGAPQYVFVNTNGTLLVFNGKYATKAYSIGIINIDENRSVKSQLNVSSKLKMLLQEQNISIDSDEALYAVGIHDNDITVRYQADKIQHMFGFVVKVSPSGELAIVKGSIKYDVVE